MKGKAKSLVRRVLDVLRETARYFKEVHLPMTASSLAYTTILSIIPVLAVSFAIFQAFGGIEKLYQHIEPFILENLAEGTDEAALNTIRTLIGRANGAAIGAGGFIALIFTCTSLLSSVENAINRVWHAKTERPWLQRFALYWLIVTLGPFAMAVGLGISESSDYPIAKFFPSGTKAVILEYLLFYLVYKYVPNRRVQHVPALLAGLFTTLGITIARGGYGLYTHRFVSYDKVYGSLGAVPIIMLWIYIVWLIFLTGAALSAVLQKRINAS